MACFFLLCDINICMNWRLSLSNQFFNMVFCSALLILLYFSRDILVISISELFSSIYLSSTLQSNSGCPHDGLLVHGLIISVALWWAALIACILFSSFSTTIRDFAATTAASAMACLLLQFLL